MALPAETRSGKSARAERSAGVIGRISGPVPVMGYSSAAVSTRSLLCATLGARRAPEADPAGAVRAAFARLGAVDVRNRLKPVKSTVNVQVVPAQRAPVNNKPEPAVKTRAAIARIRPAQPSRRRPASGPGGLLPASLPDDQAAPLHEHGP